IRSTAATGMAPGLMLRFDWNAGNINGYLIQANLTAQEWRLIRYVAGVATVLDSEAATIAADTDYVVQLYVADGVQKAWVDGFELTAADTSFDGQNDHTLALRHGASGAGGTTIADDVIWHAARYLTVGGLPTDWVAKVLDGADAV